MATARSSKDIAIEVIKQKLPLDELLSELAAEIIRPLEESCRIDDNGQASLEDFKGQVIDLLQNILKIKLSREAVENFTEKEITFLNSKTSDINNKLINIERDFSYLSKRFDDVNPSIQNNIELFKDAAQDIRSRIGKLATDDSVLASVTRLKSELLETVASKLETVASRGELQLAKVELEKTLSSKDEVRKIPGRGEFYSCIALLLSVLTFSFFVLDSKYSAQNSSNSDFQKNVSTEMKSLKDTQQKILEKLGKL